MEREAKELTAILIGILLLIFISFVAGAVIGGRMLSQRFERNNTLVVTP